jgi:hypothetical protein
MLDVGGVGQFWLDGRGALWDKIESKSRARSWYELGAEFIVAHSDLPLLAGAASHHRVTEARREGSTTFNLKAIGYRHEANAIPLLSSHHRVRGHWKPSHVRDGRVYRKNCLMIPSN